MVERTTTSNPDRGPQWGSTPRLFAALILVASATGCVTAHQAYDGPARPQSDTAIHEESRGLYGGPARIIGINEKRFPQSGLGSNSFSLLPGRHAVSVAYHDSSGRSFSSGSLEVSFVAEADYVHRVSASVSGKLGDASLPIPPQANG